MTATAAHAMLRTMLYKVAFTTLFVGAAVVLTADVLLVALERKVRA